MIFSVQDGSENNNDKSLSKTEAPCQLLGGSPNYDIVFVEKKLPLHCLTTMQKTVPETSELCLIMKNPGHVWLSPQQQWVNDIRQVFVYCNHTISFGFDDIFEVFTTSAIDLQSKGWLTPLFADSLTPMTAEKRWMLTFMTDDDDSKEIFESDPKMRGASAVFTLVVA